jgi:hypothetical protein
MTVELSEFDEECLRFYGKLLTGKKKHWCLNWDQLPIDETCEEFQCCFCNIVDEDETK